MFCLLPSRILAVLIITVTSATTSTVHLSSNMAEVTMGTIQPNTGPSKEHSRPLTCTFADEGTFEMFLMTLHRKTSSLPNLT